MPVKIRKSCRPQRHRKSLHTKKRREQIGSMVIQIVDRLLRYFNFTFEAQFLSDIVCH